MEAGERERFFTKHGIPSIKLAFGLVFEGLEFSYALTVPIP